MLPSHSGLLLVTTGIEGLGFITTMVVPGEEVQPATVIVRLYVPAAAMGTFGIEGFCKPLVNPFGPVQAYVAPVTAVVVRLRVVPLHKGPLFCGAGEAGAEGTVSVKGPAGKEGHPLREAIILV